VSIVVVGLSYKTAPVEVREKLFFSDAAVPEALGMLAQSDDVKESLILSTCNRVEIYAWVRDNLQGVKHIKHFLSDFHKLPPESLEPSLYIHSDTQGIRHVFRVASSLDSMVVGEPQILGQLKDAFETALKAKTSGLMLNKLIKKSISVAKRIRTETKIAESAVSISFAAVELSRKIFSELEGKTVMLLGAGEMAELAARHLQNNGVKSVMVTNRTFEHAVDLAREFNGSAVHFEDFPAEMMMADIVICSTGASHYVIGPDIVHKALKSRRNKPIFIIDISVPRNVDPEVNRIDNVFLYDIDDLQGVVNSNLEGRAKEAERAEEIITQEVETYLHWEQSLDAVPTIVELRDKMEEIRRKELEKTLCQMNGMTEEQRRMIEAMSTAIVNKILHAPIVVLKHAATVPESGDLFSFARKLFNLDKDLKSHKHHKGLGSSGKDKPDACN
jgi:glutamyl-tRNA reductase